MVVHFIARVSDIDENAMEGYQAPTAASIEAYGGRYLVFSDDITTLEGSADCQRIVILEFPNKSSAMQWYDSEEYAPQLAQRIAGTKSHFILVE
ncbi:MAG: DUF1330 domain-containing protein [Hyphomicrobiales bacterium]